MTDITDGKTDDSMVPGGRGGWIKKPWVKGEKVPGAGRPPTPVELRDMCRALTPEAIETAEKLMRKAKQERVKLLAVDTILDRGYGKPKQSVDVNVYSELSNTELAAEARRLAQELAELDASGDSEGGTADATGEA